MLIPIKKHFIGLEILVEILILIPKNRSFCQFKNLNKNLDINP